MASGQELPHLRIVQRSGFVAVNDRRFYTVRRIARKKLLPNSHSKGTVQVVVDIAHSRAGKALSQQFGV